MKKAKSSSWENALTLIELVILLMVIGILGLVAVPNISSYFDAKLDSCLQKVMADIRYTQYLSIAQHKSYGVEFIPSNNYYKVYDSETGDLARDPYTGGNMEMDLDTSSEFVGVNMVSVKIDAGNQIRFTSLGEPLNSAGDPLADLGEINFSYQGRSKRILIYPQTGWVEIE